MFINIIYIIKKLFSPFLVPPGIFILILINASVRSFMKRWHGAAFSFAITAVLIWLLSTLPVADLLISELERDYRIPTNISGDVIIVLGHGQYNYAPDLTGTGVPDGEMQMRLLTAFRLDKKLFVPFIISGYKDTSPTEISSVKRYLLDMGVPAKMIIMEGDSRDTIENAKLTAKICRDYGFKKPILVTSGYHMRRAVLSFGKAGLTVQPVSAANRTWANSTYRWTDYLPQSENLDTTASAIREYLGLALYRVAY